MAIMNLTPDSFYDGGSLKSEKAILLAAEKHLAEGATILDLGAMSSRPGAKEIALDEELARLLPGIKAIRKEFPTSILSADTYRSEVVCQAVDAGVDIINDITAGRMDEKMLATVAEHRVPYVMMHMQGTPATMQANPTYTDVVEEVTDFFIDRVEKAKTIGIHDIVIDLGFGFGKTAQHNFSLLKHMQRFQLFGYPILAGISRKSMITKTLGISSKEALNGTTALNMIALANGASILRVHDVKEAQQCIKLAHALN
ncbi:MAG: dihydropteroate synthase [Salibacteraceae bacterium]